jgi:ABC-2 type transport system ATP-binding protein
LIALGTLAELTAMVGHTDTIRLDVGLLEEENGQLMAQLAALPGVRQTDADDEGQLILQVEEANAVLPHVIQLISGQGLTIRKLEVQEPNLEAVFLHLTGRALRD